MTSRLPAFPRVIFTVVEPISLLGGCFPGIFSADWFISEQIKSTGPIVSTDNARLVAQQLGNVYGLLFMVGVAVLSSTNELKVVRNYLVALWIADISHVFITAYTLGYNRFIAVGEWNAMTWGNIGFTVFLCLTRTAYLLGFFGPDKPATLVPKKSN